MMKITNQPSHLMHKNQAASVAKTIIVITLLIVMLTGLSCTRSSQTSYITAEPAARATQAFAAITQTPTAPSYQSNSEDCWKSVPFDKNVSLRGSLLYFNPESNES